MDFMIKKIMAVSLVIGAFSFITYGGLIVTDQEFISSGLAACINEGFRYAGQSFTAGQSGDLFDIYIDVLPYAQQYNLEVMIFDAENGLPTSNLLSSTCLPMDNVDLSFPIVFNNEINIKAGQQYAIVVNYPEAPGPGSNMQQGTWVGAVGNGYKGGFLLYSNNLINWEEPNECDLNFRVRISVPEPDLLILLLSSFLFISIRSLFSRKQQMGS